MAETMPQTRPVRQPGLNPIGSESKEPERFIKDQRQVTHMKLVRNGQIQRAEKRKVNRSFWWSRGRKPFSPRAMRGESP